MSTERKCIIHNLFVKKNQPKNYKPNCLYTLDIDYKLDATQVLSKKLENYHIDTDGLFTIICNRDVFNNYVCYRVYDNIWNLRPFLIYGKNGIYKNLVSKGYKTYDIIDYSFDDIEAPHKRLQAFMQEIQKLSRYRNYTAIQKTLQKTTDYNFKTLLMRVKNEEIYDGTPVPKLNTLQKFTKLL